MQRFEHKNIFSNNFFNDMIPHCVKVICAKNWLDWMKNNPCTSVFVDVSVLTLRPSLHS